MIHSLEHQLVPQGRLVHITVQAAKDKSGIIPPDFNAQCAIAMTHVEHMLAAAKMRLQDMVKTTCYVTNHSHLEALHTTWQQRWPGVTPAMSAVVVAGLGCPEVLVGFEIQAYAGPEHALSEV